MKERQLRSVVGLCLLFGQLLLLVIVAVLTWMNRFTENELFASLGVIAPLLAAHATVATRRLLQQPARDRGHTVAVDRAIVAIAVPAIFLFMIIAVIAWKAFGTLTFSNFLKLIGSVQTLVGIYLGFVVETLFHQTLPHGGAGTDSAKPSEA